MHIFASLQVHRSDLLEKQQHEILRYYGDFAHGKKSTGRFARGYGNHSAGIHDQFQGYYAQPPPVSEVPGIKVPEDKEKPSRSGPRQLVPPSSIPGLGSLALVDGGASAAQPVSLPYGGYMYPGPTGRSGKAHFGGRVHQQSEPQEIERLTWGPGSKGRARPPGRTMHSIDHLHMGEQGLTATDSFSNAPLVNPVTYGVRSSKGGSRSDRAMAMRAGDNVAAVVGGTKTIAAVPPPVPPTRTARETKLYEAQATSTGVVPCGPSQNVTHDVSDKERFKTSYSANYCGGASTVQKESKPVRGLARPNLAGLNDPYRRTQIY